MLGSVRMSPRDSTYWRKPWGAEPKQGGRLAALRLHLSEGALAALETTGAVGTLVATETVGADPKAAVLADEPVPGLRVFAPAGLAGNQHRASYVGTTHAKCLL